MTPGNIGERGTTNLIVLRDVPADLARRAPEPREATIAREAQALAR
jgi:hypothetical protein